jgi:hypothetical protein
VSRTPDGFRTHKGRRKKDNTVYPVFERRGRSKRVISGGPKKAFRKFNGQRYQLACTNPDEQNIRLQAVGYTERGYDARITKTADSWVLWVRQLPPQQVPNTPKRHYVALSKFYGGQKQKTWYDWLLTNGKEFSGRPLTKEEEKELQYELGHRLYKPKQCFYNSQLIAVNSNGKYKYYEGMATTEKLSGLPFEHGWLVKDGKVYDPTWKDGKEYFGIEISVDEVRKNMVKTGMAETMLTLYVAEKAGLIKNGKKV